MMIPLGVSAIRFIMEIRTIHIAATHVPLIIPAMISPFGVFLMTQFIRDGVLNEIIESARIDGCGESLAFMKIALPFTKPAMLTLYLLIFLFGEQLLLFANKMEMYTIPLGIFSLSNQFRADYGAQMFAQMFVLSLATIPLIIYLQST